jgi:DMSO/TMAO reductase YedYZ molybdopterin-dependent catalytic subunit
MAEAIPIGDGHILDPITPTEDFFILSHYKGPKIDSAKWSLEIGGLVSSRLRLSLEDLKTSYSRVSVVATLECVINKVGGDLVGTATWTGVPLREVLGEVGIDAGAEELHLKGEDGLDRAYPLDDFLETPSLLAYEMNGKPLTIDHGFPLRLVVPGTYGFKWRRWLKAMIAIKEKDADIKWHEWTKLVRLEKIALTTKILRPHKDEIIANTPFIVAGASWGGESKIRTVEVSFDGCETWDPARIVWRPPDPNAWVLWAFSWNPQHNGHYVVTAKAIDEKGRVQISDGREDHPTGLAPLHEVGVLVHR